MIELFNEDCMEGMKRYPDKYFELAIVDPPYGIGNFNNKPIIDSRVGKAWISTSEKYKSITWNNKVPDKDYFNELFRISAHQIMFGFQHYMKYLKATHNGIIIHDFNDNSFNMSHADCAITDLQKRVTVFKYLWSGFKRACKSPFDLQRIHPCEKPVKLYEWLLKNYAKQGDKIIDTHLGSGSIAIACYNLDFDLVGFEIDKDYYDAACTRLEEHKKQQRLFG